MTDHHARVTRQHLVKIHSALPLAPLPGIDYAELRGRQPYGLDVTRAALQIMRAAGCIVSTNGGTRGKIVFQRVGELPKWLIADDPRSLAGDNIRDVFEGALPKQIASVIEQIRP